MAIRDINGKPYQTTGSVQQFDPENPEHCLFNAWDEQAIQQTGSPIFYYECFIQVGSLDKLYREDRGKLWSSHPIQLWALYEPQPSQNFHNVFGLDSPDEMVFKLNLRATLRDIGHQPKVGSRIFTPHKRENWVIIQRNITEYQFWGQIRLELLCQRFQESITTGEGKVTDKQPDFDLNQLNKRD